MTSPDTAITLSIARRLAADGTAQELRRVARLSLGDVARAVGTSPSTVLRWEGGQRRPSGDLGLRYCAFLARLAAVVPDGD